MKTTDVDDGLRDYVRHMPCYIGDRHACLGTIEPHHVITKGAGGRDRYNLVPLCTAAHGEVHTMGRFSWCRRYGFTFGDLQTSAVEITKHYTQAVG